MMFCPFYRIAALATVGVMLACPCAMAQGRDQSFPFDREMRLDANPMRDSKRVPSLNIAENGSAEIDLWCVSGKGQAVIAEASITIVPVSMQNNQCSPEQLRHDEALLKGLTEVARWRREGFLLVLEGEGKALRYRINTN